MKLFELWATLGLDTGDFESGAEAAYEKADTIGSKIGRIIGEGIGAGVNMALGLAAVTNQMAGLAKEASDTTGHIDDMAQRMGISSTAYQEWAYVFKQSGLEIDSFANSFKNLQNIMAGFGSNKQYDALSKIGLELEDIENMSVEEAFETVISGLQGVENESLRTAAAFNIFGGSGSNIPALLNQSVESIQALKQEAHALGLVFSEETIGAGADMGDEIDKYTASLDGMKTQIGAQFLPVFTDFLEALNQAAITFMPTFSAAIEKLSPILSNLIDGGLKMFTDALQWCVDHSSEVGAMLVTAAVGFAAVQLAVNPIGTIIYAIIGASMLLIANWESIKETAIGIWSSITSAIQSAVDAIRTFLGLSGEASGAHVSDAGNTHGGGSGQSFPVLKTVGDGKTRPKASGTPYVPYDNYAAFLHRGEAVLTRQQADEYRSGRSAGLDVSALADAITAGLSGATVVMDGQAVGRLVVGEVSRQIARDSRTARRYG